VKALLVDDDLELGALLTEYFGGHEIGLTHAKNGDEARALLLTHAYEVILLDVMMPGADGFTLLPEFIKHAPVIMLTARGESDDRVRGLELGARDYLPKPFNPKELLLRIRSVRGRTTGSNTRTLAHTLGALQIYPEELKATLGGTVLELTSFEFRLLGALMQHAGESVTREQLAQVLGLGADYDPSVDRSLDVHVSNLRQKLERGGETKWIRTVRGVGYLLIRPAS
jgi:DNA-binding response OmpR family regulator